jgi:AcrR family transcriptional regulator
MESVRKTAEQRKEQIVRVVLDLAAREGPDRLSTQQIARAVGLTQPAIFRHFPTKRDLWTDVAEEIAGQMRRCWRRVLAGGATPLDALRALIAAQLNLLQTRPAILAIVFSHELQYENPALRSIFRELMMGFHSRLAELVAAARGAKSGASESDAETAFLLLALVQGLALRWSMSGREFDLMEEGNRLLELQIAGLGLGGQTDAAWNRGDTR